ncbi:MAG: hypothetical protein Q4D27_07410 [Coriobacteriia bacterium]|nr:hypothetical protein [Coriobacteriia bacterium]
MAFPDPSNYGTDPRDFSGRDYALGRYFYGDGEGSGDGPDDGGGGCTGCFLVIAAIVLLSFLLIVVCGLLT